jgi:hypothetical protein
VQYILALSRSAVTIRHWFEINLDDASMEHGARIEIRELARHPRRGSESASQLGPAGCRSAAECFGQTRDVQDAVRLMIATLRAPQRLDRDRVAPWLGR